MASSSQISQTKYDVFISFRGTDIRKNFLSHLKKELQQEHIDFYVDDKLVRGDKISPSLLKAIEESFIALIVFSEGYASSEWCLKELEKIMECMDRNNQIVIPVFYNIDPSVVRNQRGSYGDALAKHEKNHRKAQIWRSALNRAASLSGFPSSNYGDEAELVEQVAKSLSTRLNIMYPCDLRNLVGIDKKIAELKSLMCQGSKDVRVIGIWGMGGAGKTTVASAIFNRFCFEYEGCCFLANVREESNKHGIIYLKNKILSMLLKDNDLHIGTPYGLPSYVERKLHRKKVLLVLDDINGSDQLESLVGSLDCFGAGSRIIITTRDKKMLNKKVDKIYTIEPLTYGEAIKLFTSIAFKESCLDMEWIDLSRKVIDYTERLPLALKVLGHLFYGTSKDEWKSQLKKLKKMPCKEINNVLRLSYDSLDHQQKQIFLYIACFFKGYQHCEITDLLDACGFSTTIELKVLHDKALITWTNNGRAVVSMHDLIQEMGWQINCEKSVENPQNRNHLLDHNDIHEVLKNGMGTEAIQSIILEMSKIKELSLNPKVFLRMHKLKFLKFGVGSHLEVHVHLPQGLEYLPNELRLLHWDCYPSKHLPSTFLAENLVQLVMRKSNLEKLWDGVVPLVNLKRINLSCSKHLIELPDFSMAKNLVQVKLHRCKRLLSVHPSILSLHKLEVLILSDCKKLTCLKSDVHLKSLRLLNLDGCSRLKEFSVTSEIMHDLILSGTAIEELTSSMGYLSKLKLLRLNGCTRLKHLPSNLVNMTSLCELYITNCIQLQSVPKLPPFIKSVWAFNCRSLETLSLAGDWINSTMDHFGLQNCMKLDQHLLCAIGLNLYLNLINHGFNKVLISLIRRLAARVIYPGNKVPEWFKYRSSHGSITIAPQSQLQGFIFSMILPKSFPSSFSVEVICSIENNDGKGPYVIPFTHIHGKSGDCSDHVCLFDRENWGMPSYYGNAHCLKISFEFFAWERKPEQGKSNGIAIKKCGVYPIYKFASKRNNLMKEMVLELLNEIKTERCGDIDGKEHNEIGIRVASCDFDEQQPFLRTKRLKLYDQSTLPAPTWKRNVKNEAKLVINSTFRRWKRTEMKERKRKSM